MPRNQGHVFVSHAHQDKADARRVVDALKSAGLSVWWDEQLPTHRMFSQVLEERIRSADAVVVLWSKHAAASEWVRAEADLARTLGTLVQVTVDGDLPPLPFNQIHCAQLAGWNGSNEHREWRKVLDGVYAVANLTSNEHLDVTTQVQSPRSKRVILGALLAIALVTIGSAFYVWNPTAQPASADAARFAVLPFQAIGEDAAAIRFASELTDIVTGSLSEHQIQTFAPAQASTLAGEGHRAALQALGADLALTGTVTATDSRLRVRAYIEDVPTGATVWSATFEQPLEKLSPLMIQVSTAVTESAFTVADTLQQPGVRPDARILGLYLKTMEFTKGSKFYRESLNLAEQIVRLAPQSAAGHALLALLLSEDPAMSARAHGLKPMRQSRCIRHRRVAPMTVCIS